MHVGHHNAARLHVAFDEGVDHCRCLLFQEVKHCQFGLSAVHSEYPTDLREMIMQLELFLPNVCLVHFDDAWQFEVWLHPCLEIM